MDPASTFARLKVLFEENYDPEFERGDEATSEYSDIAQFREGLDREAWGGVTFADGPRYYEDPLAAREGLEALRPVFEQALSDYPALIDALVARGDLERLNEMLNWAYGITEAYGSLATPE